MRQGMQRMNKNARAAAAVAAVLALAGCISLGGKVPDRLLNLTAASTAPAGATASGSSATALTVLDIEAPQELDVARVPVRISGSSLAYLKGAQWVERPARLFQHLLAETLRAHGNGLVTEGDGLSHGIVLSGRLIDFGYDAGSGAVVVRYDAVRRFPDGTIQTHRFEASEPNVAARAEEVGPALDHAANKLAKAVADWVG